MKLLLTSQIKVLDAETIRKKKISSFDLMERAATTFFHWMMKNNIPSKDTLIVFAGTGNNGGDGVALIRIASRYFKNSILYVCHFSKSVSKDFKKNMNLLPEEVKVININSNNLININFKNALVIDGIIGTGLSRSIFGVCETVIGIINKNAETVFSIDIPSGLFADHLSNHKTIIRADRTLSFGLPKLSFLFPENEEFIGKWEYLDIGLDTEIHNEFESKSHLIIGDEIINLIRTRKRHEHKGSYGHALIIAGSGGMAGAAVMAGMGCIKSGVGKCSMAIPEECINIIQMTIPEIITIAHSGRSVINTIPSLKQFSAIGIGPGLGVHKKTKKALFHFLKELEPKNLVLDADALNIIAEEEWLEHLPPNSVITPHPGEFKRLFGNYINSEDRNKIQLNNSAKYKIYIICKGGYTTITTPYGDLYYNINGNPGMATAGSGDVLTGIITSFRAQGYNAEHSCILGVYIHGKAGDLASVKYGEIGLIARDILEFLPIAFKKLNGK